MTLHKRVPLTAAQLQLKEFNESGPGIQRVSYSPPPGQAWAVVGCVFAPVVTEQQADETLPPLFDALVSVTETMPDRFWMPTPATNEAENHTFDLHVSYTASGTEVFAGEGTQSWRQDGHRVLNDIAISKKAGVYVLRLPAVLDGPGRTDLEEAVSAIPGVSLCEVMLSGVIPENVTGASLRLEVRYRLDPIPVEV